MGRGGLVVMVVDDELLARQRLDDLLGRIDGIERVLTAASGREAVAMIAEHEPDLVFLDMQMPGMNGLEVVRTVGAAAMPVTIFVTAYDDYAIQAFEVQALDYLLKPFEDDRFHQALERAVRQVELREVGDAAQRLVGLLDRSEPEGAPGMVRDVAGLPGRIAVEAAGRVDVVPIADITHITAAGPYAEIHTPGRTYFIRETMQRLEQRLEADGFFRIHRSAIVRLDRVDTLNRGSGGAYSLRLAGGPELTVSRARIRGLEQRLGVDR